MYAFQTIKNVPDALCHILAMSCEGPPHGSETEDVAPNEDFWIKEGLDGEGSNVSCQLKFWPFVSC